MASHPPIQFSLRILLLAVTVMPAMLWAASRLGGLNVLTLSLMVLIASAAAAGVGGWLFLEKDVVRFGAIGAVVGLLFGFLGVRFGESLLGGVLLGVLIGDVLRDCRREPLFAAQWRRTRHWHLIDRCDRVYLSRLALAVACLAALCPLVGFWIAIAISPTGIDWNSLAADFWAHVIREFESQQSVREGAYLQILPYQCLWNWHVLGMLVLCLVLCIRLRRREAESPVVQLYLGHVSTALALAILLFSFQVSRWLYYVYNFTGDIYPKRFFFDICFYFVWNFAPVILVAPLVPLALWRYRGRFLRNHVWLPALAAIGLLNIIILFVLFGCTAGPLR